MYTIYNTILQDGADDTEATDFARGCIFEESYTRKNLYPDSRYINTVDGINVYYNRPADYYYFVDAEPADTWEVWEFSGLDNALIVDEFPTLRQARAYVSENYDTNEQKEMSIDITRNGSTEF